MKILKVILPIALAASTLLVPASASANSRDVPLDLSSTNTEPDVNFVWQGSFYPEAGRFCVRVRNVNVSAGATVEKPNGKTATFSATNGNPDCQKVAFSTDAPAIAYGYARDTSPGGTSGNTGYFNILRG